MEILVSAWLSEADATKMEIGELGRGVRLDGVLLVRREDRQTYRIEGEGPSYTRAVFSAPSRMRRAQRST
jgi:hypothetical protein